MDGDLDDFVRAFLMDNISDNELKN
jgi:hypothetical protein